MPARKILFLILLFLISVLPLFLIHTPIRAVKSDDEQLRDLEKINNSSVPLESIERSGFSRFLDSILGIGDNEEGEVGGQSQAGKGDKAGEYFFASTVRGNGEVIKSDLSFLQQIFNTIIGLFEKGNEEADNLASSFVPLGSTDDFLADSSDIPSDDKLNENSQVMGIFKSKKEKAMEKSLTFIQNCVVLPFGFSNECNSEFQRPIAPSPTLYVSPSPGVGGLPSPTQAPNSGSCIIPSSGYCSFDYLRQYFPSDLSARQAAQICNRESGGDAGLIFDRCLLKYDLSKRTRDYSIGLFQINMLAHLNTLINSGIIAQDCRGLLIDNWNTTRSCYTPDEAKLRSCVAPMQDPVNNIRFALVLSRNGTYWTPWSTAAVCGITGGIPVPSVSPPPALAGIVRVNQLVTDISLKCQGSVNASNMSCLNNILPSLPNNVLSALRCFYTCNNPPFNYLQCINFAHAGSRLLSYPLKRSGNARTYANQDHVNDGWRFIYKNENIHMRAGDIPIWDWVTAIGGYTVNVGHIAVTVDVLANGNFQVAEANFNSRGGVRISNKDKNAKTFVGFLRYGN